MSETGNWAVGMATAGKRGSARPAPSGLTPERPKAKHQALADTSHSDVDLTDAGEVTQVGDGAPEWFKQFERRQNKKFEKITKEFNHMRKMIKEVRQNAEEAKEAAAEAKERCGDLEVELHNLREDVEGLYVTKEELQHTVEIMVAAEVQEALEKLRGEGMNIEAGKMGKEGQEEEGSEGDEKRELQVIVGGFKEETEEDEIVRAIEGFLAEGTRRHKVNKVFTFSDPARVGVIQFDTEASKIGFYKKIRNVSKQVSDNLKLWFTNNRTYKQRLRDKTLGRIKHWLIEKKGCDPEDVRIAWKNGSVSVTNKKVAWVRDNSEMILKGVAEEVRDEVEEDVEEWKGKRTKGVQME